jgi:mono/diheme cytochrome c family protein
MALAAAAARHAPHLSDPIAPTEANLLVGVKRCKDDCAGCHGSAAQLVDTGVGLYRDAPHFAKWPPREPDWQLFWIVKNGVRYSGMFAWDGQWGKDSTGKDVTDQKIWTTVTFLKHLDALPPSVAAEWHTK